ncbi:MAG TPA: flagellar hook protein FlgE [Nitrospirota bacterium]|nr:flagellar hook protein FlgE [Nitrospirota bacterium]
MLTSMYTAVSGMDANGTALSVISDNISNMNTIGFKSSTVTFGDVLSQSLTGASAASQLGRGVQVMSVTPQFTQGSFESTSNGLDLAVDGDGFFMVTDSAGAKYYTRDGEFSIDKNGNIVNPDNLALQGYLADAAGNITGTTGNLQIATRQSPANITTAAQVALNLDATATPPAAAFTLDGNGDGIPNDPANFNFSDTTTIYDSQGGAQQVTMYFVKTAANTWTTHYAYADPGNPGSLMEAGQTSGGAGNPPVGAAATQALTFNADGSLNNDNSGTALAFNFGGGVTAPQNVSFNFGTGTGEAPAGTGLDMTTQFASASSVMNLTQDGYASGSLKSVSVSQAGVITGVFTNGQTRAIGQVALARFIAPTGLTKLGRNLYGESFNSGQPIIGQANTSGIGQVTSNSLELSNVDLAQEFVKMITAQRGFEANSKVITTTDQLMQELVNLKQ